MVFFAKRTSRVSSWPCIFVSLNPRKLEVFFNCLAMVYKLFKTGKKLDQSKRKIDSVFSKESKSAIKIHIVLKSNQAILTLAIMDVYLICSHF